LLDAARQDVRGYEHVRGPLHVAVSPVRVRAPAREAHVTQGELDQGAQPGYLGPYMVLGHPIAHWMEANFLKPVVTPEFLQV